MTRCCQTACAAPGSVTDPTSVRKATRPARDLGALAGAELGEEHLCLALGRLQKGRRITADGSDPGVVTEQQCCDLPRAGDPTSLHTGCVDGRCAQEQARGLIEGHLRPVPGQ